MRVLRWAPLAAIVAAAVAGLPAGALGAQKLSPPVIHERFTPLPCHGRPGHRTTVEQEGCAEHQILRTDRSIDGLSRSIFHLLSGGSARRHFVTAENAWLSFREADCRSVSDEFQGGTQAPVVDAQCAARRNLERIRDLRSFQRDLRRHG